MEPASHRIAPPGRVLLWKIGALGDVVMTTPLLRQLRRAWPAARIHYLVGQGSASLLHGNPDVDVVLGFDEQVLNQRQLARVPQLVRLLRGYDQVFVLDKHLVFGLLAWAARAPRRTGFARSVVEGWPHTTRVPYGALRHEIDCYLDLAQAAGVAVDRQDRRLQVPSPPPCQLPAAPYIVLVNAGGNNAREQSNVRRMPQPLFDALVAHCRTRARVVFVGTPDEAASYGPWQGEGVENLCGRLTLAQVTAVLQHAAQVVTTDCGLMHMAGAVNEAVTAVFGPTHPLRKCPPGARWVWRDEDRYQPGYEVRGTLPRGPFFERMTLADIVAAMDRSGEPGAR